MHHGKGILIDQPIWGPLGAEMDEHLQVLTRELLAIESHLMIYLQSAKSLANPYSQRLGPDDGFQRSRQPGPRNGGRTG